MSSNDVKKIEKQNIQAAVRKKEDFQMNRLLAMLVAVTAVIVLMLLFRRNSRDFDLVFITYVLPVLKIVSAAGVIAAVVNAVLKHKNGADESFRYLSSPVLCGIAAVFALMCFTYEYVLMIGVVVIMIAALILHFLYCFYQRDFFWVSVAALTGGLLLCGSVLDGTAVFSRAVIKSACTVLAILLPLILIVAVLLLKKHNGMIQCKGKKIRLMKPGYLYSPFAAIAAVTLLGAVVAILAGSLMSYALIVLATAYIIIAIAYTVKMI